MSNDSLAHAPMNLHGPLCKIFYDSSLNKLEDSINEWIREHPNAYIEQQETTPVHRMNSATGMVVVTIWYTEDTTENKNAHFCEHGRLWFECSKCAKLDDLKKESE